MKKTTTTIFILLVFVSIFFAQKEPEFHNLSDVIQVAQKEILSNPRFAGTKDSLEFYYNDQLIDSNPIMRLSVISEPELVYKVKKLNKKNRRFSNAKISIEQKKINVKKVAEPKVTSFEIPKGIDGKSIKTQLVFIKSNKQETLELKELDVPDNVLKVQYKKDRIDFIVRERTPIPIKPDYIRSVKFYKAGEKIDGYKYLNFSEELIVVELKTLDNLKKVIQAIK